MNKILSLILCVFLLLGVVGCIQTPEKQPQETEPKQTSAQQIQEPNEQQSQLTYEEQKALYSDVISQYTELLAARHNGEELSAPNTESMGAREADIAEVLYGIVNEPQKSEYTENMGYGFKDLDGNGTPELIILTRAASIKAIFTIADRKPILLEANFGKNTAFFFTPEKRVFMMRSTFTDDIQEIVFYTCHVDGKKMVYDAVYGKVYSLEKKEVLEIFQIANGNRISITEEAFNELNREYESVYYGDDYDIFKLSAPRIYLPLSEVDTNEDLPVADFSSYSAIRETYKKMSVCLDEFNPNYWLNSEYDNRFAFPNDLAFDYYNRLLYATCYGNCIEGYDEIDLNGDGQDELVLMDEDYSIRAIFTQKDGVPILLDAFAHQTCWLDGQGLIHVDNEEYYELEYSLYDFTQSGEYNLIYSILFTNDGNRYFTKDGKTEQIAFEKSLELYYDDYCRYPEPFEPNEQTRTVSDINYTPLFERSADQVEAAYGKVWCKDANLEKTTGKQLANSRTDITIRNLSDTQAELDIKYRFTFAYPDPDRDNYFLNDVVESTLKISARKEKGMLIFDESGVKGRIEIGDSCVWVMIEESADERFIVGNHCYTEYSPEDYIS